MGRQRTRAGYDTTLGWTVWIILGLSAVAAGTWSGINSATLSEWLVGTLLFTAGFAILPPVWLVAFALEHLRRLLLVDIERARRRRARP